MLKAKQYKLPSGLRVVLVPMPDSPTITVEVLVETGSKYESKKELGLSHFLEHMCFKGTKKRPSALAVSRSFDELGAINNAFTDTEITGYFAKAGVEYVSQTLDIVTDIYLNAIFKKEDLEREKGVIVEEINMYEDNPQAMVAELFTREMHGKQPAGLSVIGTKASVRSFTTEDFEAYRQKHYVASATTIVIAGHFNEKKILAEIKTLLAPVSRARKVGKRPTKIAHRGPRVVTKHKETDQVHLILGVRSFPYKDKRNLPLSVLRGVLSSGMSSRLFQKLREELGICYYVNAGNVTSTDHGEFYVESGVDPKRVDEAVSGILAELKRLKVELISEEELSKVKTSMISKMHMGLETSDAVSNYFAGRSIFNHDLLNPHEQAKKIASVTAKQVQDLAKEMFTNKDLLLAVVGKNVNLEKLKKVLKF